MNEFFKRIREQIVQIWTRMNRGQKIGVVASLVTLFLALGLLLFVSNRPEKHTLYTDLTAEDADVVVKALKEGNVKYELEKGGSTVVVYGPVKAMDEVKLDLAAKGVPKGGGIGWEFLEKQQFGATDKTFDAQSQRAKETELKRTIETMSQIKSARVTLAEPKESVFVEKEQPSTASVVLELKPNETLKENQIAAITNLVSHAVPKLKSEDVSVVDTNGNLLSAGDKDMPMGLSSKQWDIQRGYQQMVQRQVQSLLDRTLGPNHAIARVGLELDFSKKKVDTEAYSNDPKNPVKVSEQKKEESYAGGEVKPGGPNGATGNIPSYPGIMGQGPSDYRQGDNIINYAPTKQVTQKEKAPAEVKRVTVGVLVDDQLHLSKNKLDELQNVVALAAGFAPGEKNSDGVNKGDVQIKPIVFQNFETPPKPEEPWWLKYLPLLLLVAIAFITFLMLGAMLQPKRQIPARAPRKAVITPAAALPTAPGGTAAAIPTGAAAVAIGASGAAGGHGGSMPMAGGAETPRGFWESLEEQREEAERRLLSDIETALQDSPKISADLIRGWMKQDRAETRPGARA